MARKTRYENGVSIKAKGPESADIYIYEDVGESWWRWFGEANWPPIGKRFGNVLTINVRLNSYVATCSRVWRLPAARPRPRHRGVAHRRDRGVDRLGDRD